MDHVTCGGRKRVQGRQDYFFLIELIFELNLGKLISFSLAERKGVLERRSAKKKVLKQKKKYKQKQAAVV